MDFLAGAAPDAARRLLGCELVRTLDDGTVLTARIIETEAYDETDPASHSFRGKSDRTAAMFGPPGRAYIYLSYGIHYCFNIVCGPEGHGAGVLIRAVRPLKGIERMRQLRGKRPDAELTNGPGKVGQALAVTPNLYGHDMRRAPFQLVVRPAVPDGQVVVTTRVGISQAADVPWRFVLK